VTLCCCVSGSKHFEGIIVHLTGYTASHPRRLRSNTAVRTSDLTVFVLFEQVMLERSFIVYLACSDWVVGWIKTFVV